MTNLKKAITAAVIGLLLVGGYYWLSKQKIRLSVFEGKTVVAKRGDLVIPINASGLIEPAMRVMIKSKASGEVSRIYVEEGDLVRKGQLLLELDPADEQRSVERAQAEADRAYATLLKSSINLWQQIVDYPISLARANANLAAAEARLAKLKWQYEKTLESYNRKAASELELQLARASYEEAQANVDLAWAEVEAAYNRRAFIESAKEDVELAKASYEATLKTLEDAQQRLKETKVYSPIDGMVVKINTRVGEVIQSGKTSLTGGTVLMELADISNLYVVAQVDEADIGTVLQIAPPAARPGMQRFAAASEPSASRSAQPNSAAPPARQPRENPAATATQQVDDMVTERLPAGKPVKITVEAFRDETFEGVIEQVSPEPLRSQSVVTYDVKIRLISPNRYKLLLGMQADVEFTAESVKNAILIPIDAVKRGPDGQLGVYVPVPSPDGTGEKPEFRKCKFGLDDGAYIEVLKGLTEGERVYTKLPAKTPQERRKEQESE